MVLAYTPQSSGQECSVFLVATASVNSDNAFAFLKVDTKVVLTEAEAMVPYANFAITLTLHLAS